MNDRIKHAALPSFVDLIEAWLKSNGYDGLYCPGECACLIGDLAPCCNHTDDIVTDCFPGFRVDGCDSMCANGGGCDWHVQATKPEPPKEARDG